MFFGLGAFRGMSGHYGFYGEKGGFYGFYGQEQNKNTLGTPYLRKYVMNHLFDFINFIAMKVEYENGYPSKRSVLELIQIFGFKKNLFTFNDDYGIVKAGLKWYPNTLNKDIDSFARFLEWNGIDIKSEKYQGRTHSLWFAEKICTFDL